MTLHVGSVGSPIRGNTMEPEVYRQLINLAHEGRTGVLSNADFIVTQNGTPNMSVNVAAGFCVVPGTNNSPVEGSYNAYNDAPVNVPIATSSLTNPRIDLIVVTIEDAYYSGGVNTGVIQAITGSPAGSPTVPATPANSLVLAHVYVGTGVSSIVTSNINGTAGAGNPDTIGFDTSRVCQFQGFAAGGSSAGITSTTSPGTLVAGALAPINVCTATRNIKIVTSGWLANSANAIASVSIWRDGVTLLVQQNVAANVTDAPHGMTYVDTPTAGMHTYSARAWVTSGNVVVWVCSLLIEDIGPV